MQDSRCEGLYLMSLNAIKEKTMLSRLYNCPVNDLFTHTAIISNESKVWVSSLPGYKPFYQLL